jgi:hypothetical protein
MLTLPIADENREPMQLYISPHEDAFREERKERCPRGQCSGVQFDFIVSGMRVVVPCDCPVGAKETTVCEIGNTRARAEANPSRHRRASNIAGRPKSQASYWRRVRRPDEVLAELDC